MSRNGNAFEKTNHAKQKRLWDLAAYLNAKYAQLIEQRNITWNQNEDFTIRIYVVIVETGNRCYVYLSSALDCFVIVQCSMCSHFNTNNYFLKEF
jgi:hypothetical protein